MPGLNSFFVQSFFISSVIVVIIFSSNTHSSGPNLDRADKNLRRKSGVSPCKTSPKNSASRTSRFSGENISPFPVRSQDSDTPNTLHMSFIVLSDGFFFPAHNNETKGCCNDNSCANLVFVMPTALITCAILLPISSTLSPPCVPILSCPAKKVKDKIITGK